jgi:short-subunit dehydrogenase
MAKAADVAKAGIDGMLRGKRVIIPGITNKLVPFSGKIIPRRILVAISGKMVQSAPHGYGSSNS